MARSNRREAEAMTAKRPQAPRVQRSGWYSTKLHLACISIVVLTLAFAAVVAATGNAAGWGEYCLALVSLVASYSCARVAESFAQRRPLRTPIAPTDEAP